MTDKSKTDKALRVPLVSNAGERRDACFPMIGVSASAGGLEAFEQFFRAMPPESRMAFVLVSHLAQNHASMLTEIIQRATKMPVVEAPAALGVILPEEGYEEARNNEIAQVRRKRRSRLVSSPIELPVMDHPEMLMVSKLLITTGPPCFRSHQRLWGVIAPNAVNMKLHYGNNIPTLRIIQTHGAIR